MRLPYPVCCCLLLLMLFAPTIAQNAPGLVVAWVDGGDLMRWEGGEVEQIAEFAAWPYLSPDGEKIAFTRAGDDGKMLSSSLWLWDAETRQEKQLFSIHELPTDADSASRWIHKIEWLDSARLLFNTIYDNPMMFDSLNDLWQVNIETGEVSQLRTMGNGGDFTVSLDGEHIALVIPGTYEVSSSQISIVNTETFEGIEMLTFPAVSTASEYHFYPPVFWEADRQALRVAIPDPDAIYHDGEGLPVSLWRVTIHGESEKIGEVPASFFGLPVWSFDGQHLLYMQRIGGATSNTFNLMLAAGDGTNPLVYASGEAGTIGSPRWLPDAPQFVFNQGEVGAYWLGASDTPPTRLAGMLYSPLFLENGWYVYEEAGELHYARLGGDQIVTVARLQFSAITDVIFLEKS